MPSKQYGNPNRLLPRESISEKTHFSFKIMRKKPNKSAETAASDPPNIEVRCAFTRMAPIAELKPNPRNPNHHSEHQIKLLAKVIQFQGWRSPVVVSKRSGFVVAGHGRLQAAKLLQLAEVPIDLQEFASEADEMAHLVADNRLSELAEIDDEELAAILKDVEGKVDSELMGFTAEELSKLTSYSEPDAPEDFNYAEQFGVVVICQDESNQKTVYDKLQAQGFNCRVVVT